MHNLIIKSLYDAKAACSCDKWHYSYTGELSRKQIEEEHGKHLKQDAGN